MRFPDTEVTDCPLGVGALSQVAPWVHENAQNAEQKINLRFGNVWESENQRWQKTSFPRAGPAGVVGGACGKRGQGQLTPRGPRISGGPVLSCSSVPPRGTSASPCARDFPGFSPKSPTSQERLSGEELGCPVTPAPDRSGTVCSMKARRLSSGWP